MFRKVVPTLLAAGLCLPCAYTRVAAAASHAQTPQARAVYVSVTQKDGAPVTDLTAADFDVKEGGKPCQVVGAELTKTPLRLALIVADAGTGAFQYPLISLVQKL